MSEPLYLYNLFLASWLVKVNFNNYDFTFLMIITLKDFNENFSLSAKQSKH